MLPCAEEIAHLTRTSGKSVTARTSITPHTSSVASPTSSRPIAPRIALRAPSQPTTYAARTEPSDSATVTPSASTETPVAVSP